MTPSAFRSSGYYLGHDSAIGKSISTSLTCKHMLKSFKGIGLLQLGNDFRNRQINNGVMSELIDTGIKGSTAHDQQQLVKRNLHMCVEVRNGVMGPELTM